MATTARDQASAMWRKADQACSLPMMSKLGVAADLLNQQLTLNMTLIAELERLAAEVEELKGRTP